MNFYHDVINDDYFTNNHHLNLCGAYMDREGKNKINTVSCSQTLD